MLTGNGNTIILGGVLARCATSSTLSTSSTLVVDADNKMIAVKFTPETDHSVSDVDMFLLWTGDCTGANFKLGIYADSADVPDIATGLVGGLTSEFAGANGVSSWCGGGVNPIALSAAASLTANTPYWLVFQKTSGTTLSGSVKASARGISNIIIAPNRARCFNGTDWTTVAAIQTMQPFWIIKSGSKHYGYPLSASTATSGQTNIYGDNKQGISFKTANKANIRGIVLEITKTGSPNDLLVTPYINTTAGTPILIAASSIISNIPMHIYFPTPLSVTPNVINYVILSQDEAGGDNSNDYALRSTAIVSGYINALQDDNNRMVSGTGTPPTTAIATEHPHMWPIISDMLADLTESARDYPDVGNVTEDDTVGGVQGTYHEATEAEVQSGVTFGASSALTGTYEGGAGGSSPRFGDKSGGKF